MSTTPTHTAAVIGTLTFANPQGEFPQSLAAGIEGVTDFDPVSRTMAPDATGETVSAPSSPANGLIIKTPKPMRIRLNGGTEYIRVDRLLVIIGGNITQVELNNDQQTTPKQLTIDLTFITGDTLT